jgi:hypothetical protein
LDISRILAELRAERDRLDQAISALEGVTTARSSGARKPGAARGGRRRLSAAGRRRLSELMKKRWASGKMKGRGKAKAA